MELNPNVTIIPAKPKGRYKNVAIYARVSSNSSEQFNSLTVQVSSLTKLTVANPNWLLVDVYMDVASSKTGSNRKGFNRMVEDSILGKIDIVITKSISRFGRDSLEVLTALEKLTSSGTRVIFVAEGLDTDKDDARLFISVYESFAQAENESRSENIRWGIKQQALKGTSKLYNRKCYGYKNDVDGSLIIFEEEANVVRMIFNLYLHGESTVAIIKELEKRQIQSPTGKDKWSKNAIDKILARDKYIGNVTLLDNGKYENAYRSVDNHPAIISEEIFDAVQIMKGSRSNIEKSEDGVKRKSTKYSSKKK